MNEPFPPLRIYPDRPSAAAAAADHAARIIKDAIAQRGEARIIAATGASQIEFVEALVGTAGIDWSRVEMFHLDEYIGLSIEHPASFRRYLLERLIRPTGITRYHLLDGESDPAETCATVGRDLQSGPIDVVFAGIGENGHVAFNDPPANFTAEAPYLIVELDDACRRQQFSEGWFPTFDDVPRQAITLSVQQLLKTNAVITLVPDTRKAAAAARCLEGPISPDAPASILRQHPGNHFYFDEAGASELSDAFRAAHVLSS
ncbi:glucosamine-6-phosphate deaminase [Synoicihabitans lomoniglobus]|uniref:Glucosamine-6-phosphate deaminase n=1 Tax=Synoicihabitans lomoniglobus TaxID=2909285 RepID=A0AAF0CRE8_9BACT|nr:glucosamine-6-phosphate deaminase [Opitutaceae bacterium LMO-M01]WED66671.1 glucosamine-6-phosphate deaminase [Opitutaceae bacterium LMO-M01]